MKQTYKLWFATKFDPFCIIPYHENMTTKAVTKIVNNLSNEVKALRSLIISVIGKDNEGEYRPAFVKGVLKDAKRKPIASFSGAKDFLKKLRRV